ncbi:MAG: hypothetical protein QF724_09695 [Planctomycetota bacterium]|nr:hypothetical protein [Planctomycetota bacterium]MDP6369021.1 hypothetical protein [Planctomycetota bacterium]MDP6518276.1 hypothetical protein [Planctomycetota bacterium]MDP6839197.1 hypothetical protein [Planctomycetota bacterium]MDP6955473.1 hypothetical protein [Planctomycetota bacterium]
MVRTIHKTNDRPRSGWKAATAGLALASLLSAAALAQVGGGGGYADDNDDTIGTLPMIGGSGFGDEVAPLDTLAALQFEGSYPAILEMVQSATGDGYAVLERLEGLDTARLSFHGDIDVVLDQAAFMNLAPNASLAAGPLSGGMLAAFGWNDALMGPQAVQAYCTLELPIAFLVEADILNPGLATVHTQQAETPRRRLVIEGAAGSLAFHQGN